MALLAILPVFIQSSLHAEGGMLVLPAASGKDGYAIDQTGDEHGDVKILGTKVRLLPIGETSDTAEARAWIPFVLTENEKAAVLQTGTSVTLRLFLSGKSNTSGLRVDIYGAGYRTAYQVNQSDYDTLRRKLVPNAFNETSQTGVVHEFDVTEFVREEARRPDAEGVALGFLLQIHDERLLPVADGVTQVFQIGSTTHVDEAGRPALLVGPRAAVTNPPDPEPSDARAMRVLIIGNSILKNGPLPDIGWAGNWGMAASAPEKDFVHLLMARIEATLGRPVVFMIHNMAFWENTWSVIRHDIPLVTYARDFNPDVIVSCISENTGLYDHQVSGYMAKYEDMISLIAGGKSGTRQADVLVRGSFWTINANTDLALSRVAASRGWPYVSCSDLCTQDNLGWTADYYLGPGEVQPSVLNHPNDRGMQAITDRIWGGGLSELLTREYVLPTTSQGYREWSVIFRDEKRNSITAPLADPDGDGLPNLLEYALDCDPLKPSVNALPTVGTLAIDDNIHLTFTTTKNPDATDVNYTVESSTDLVTWTNAGLVTLTDTTTRLVVRDSQPLGTTPRFFRLNINDDAITSPLGGMVHLIPGNSVQYLGVPFACPPVWRGPVTSIQANTLSFTNAEWEPASFVSRPHYIEIIGGPWAGLMSDITGNTANTLMLADALPGDVVAGQVFAIRPHATLAGIFGALNSAGLQGGSSLATADEVRLFDPVSQGSLSFYYKTSGIGGTGWRGDSSPSIDRSGTRLYPERALAIIRRATTNLRIPSVGEARAAQLIFTIEPGINWLTATQPTPLTLAQSNLYTGTPDTSLKGGASLSTADELLRWTGLKWESFYYKTSGIGGTGWRGDSSPSIDRSSQQLNPGDVFTIRRRAPSLFIHIRPETPLPTP